MPPRKSSQIVENTELMQRVLFHRKMTGAVQRTGYPEKNEIKGGEIMPTSELSHSATKTKREPLLLVTLLSACFHRLRYGGPCWARTSGPLIKSQLLYQLS